MPPTFQEQDRINAISRKVVGAAIEVHRHLGAGLLESTYQVCLEHELRLAGVAFEPQLPLPIEYKDLRVAEAYRMDLFVEGVLIVELKSVDKLEGIHEAQLLTYLRLKKIWAGLLINFNVALLKDGVRRMVQG